MKTLTLARVLLAVVLITPTLAQAELPGDVAPTQSSSSCVNLLNDLQYRSMGGEVSQLQDFLQSKGYLNSEPTGYFGLLTQAAVKSYQAASGILNSGYVGPITRGKIQAVSCGAVSNPPGQNLPDGCQSGTLFSSTTGERCVPLVACTMEAKMCPDGSYVGRQGPSCAFATCPALSSSAFTITTSSKLPNAQVGKPYSVNINTSGGPESVGYRWSVNGGAASFPVTGLGLKSPYGKDNAIIGTPATVYLNGVEVVKPYTSTFSLNAIVRGQSAAQQFTLTVDPREGGDSAVEDTFSYRQLYGAGLEGQTVATYTYRIKNYRRGLVLDVEPTVNCNDMHLLPLRRDCSMYRFDLTGKAAESYMGVAGNPFVKGGALYRFTGADGALNLTGYVLKEYAPGNGFIHPSPDYIDYRFILRDLNQGGAELWSTTERVQLKG